MGLYDNYRQSNSTRIPEFAGSVIPDLKYMKEDLDVKYNTALSTVEETNYKRKIAPVLHLKSDQEAYKSVMTQADTDIAEITKRPDYENMVVLTRKVAQKTAMGLRPLAKRAENRTAYAATLKDLTPEKQSLLLAKSDDDDQRYGKGVYTNPITGELDGTYTGVTAAKQVDMPKKIEEWVKGAIPLKTGEEIVQIGGQWIVKNGSSSTVLDPERIKGIIRNASALDADVQAYIKQEGELSGWQSGKMAKSLYSKLPETVKDAKGNVIPNKTKEDIDALVASGIPLRDAVERVGASLKETEMRGIMDDLAVGKFRQNDRTSTKDVSANAYGVQEAATAAATNTIRLTSPDQTTEMEGWAKTEGGVSNEITKANAAITSTDKEIAVINKSLETATGDAKGQLNTKKNELIATNNANKKVKSEMENILVNRRNLAAQQVTGNVNTTFASLTATEMPKAIVEVKKAYPNGLATKGGQQITHEEIAMALLSGSVKSTKYGGRQFYVPGKGLILIPGIMKNSSSAGAAASGGAAYSNTLDDVMATPSFAANTVTAKALKIASALEDMPQTLAGTRITLKDNEIKVVKNSLEGRTNYAVGTLTKEDAPEGWDKDKSEVTGYNGQTQRSTVVYKDKDGNYLKTLQVSLAGSGLAESMSADIAKNNTATPGLQQAGADLDPRSGTNMLLGASKPELVTSDYYGTPLMLDYRGKGPEPVKFYQSNQGTFALWDESGNVINYKGVPLQSGDPGKVGHLFKNAVETGEFYKESKKQN